MDEQQQSDKQQSDLQQTNQQQSDQHEVAIVYTDQLNQMIEMQQLGLITSFIFLGLFTVGIVISLFNRYI